MQKQRRKLRIGIAYSGGISKCAYQLGFTKSLLKYIDKSEIVAVSGASMGIFTGYALSANKLERLELLYRQIDIEKPWELIWKVFKEKLFSEALNNFISLGDKLSIPVGFPVCYVPLLATKYYWLQGEYNPGWKKYIEAATNFPLLHLSPILQKGRLAFDGGAVDNIPIFPLLQKGRTFESLKLDLIIALHFDSRYDYRKYFFNHPPILDLDISISNNFKKNHFDFSIEYIEEMIEKAEEYADGICSVLFSGDCSSKGLQKKIDDIFLSEHEIRQKNSSADGLVSVLNVLGKTFRGNSECSINLF